MDPKKLKVMADLVEQGADVDFDSEEEAKAVSVMLAARKGSAQAQNPAQTIKSADSFLAGAKPGIMDYAPALGVAKDAATFGGDSLGSKYQSMTPEEKQDLVINMGSYSDKERHEMLRDLVKLNFQREIDKNKSDRAAAQKADPMGYGMGQMASGVGLGMAGGMAAGPSVLGQAIAGGATNFAMDPTPESALLGAAGGAAATMIPGAIGKGMRSSGKTLSKLTAADNMIGDYLGISSDDIIKYKQDGTWEEMADIVRANSGTGAEGPQAMREAIEQPAINRGAEGTVMNPMQSYPKHSKLPAEMSAPPANQSTGKSWLDPSGKPREIDLDMGLRPEDDALAEFHGEPTNRLWEGQQVRPGRSAVDLETGRPVPGTFQPPEFKGGASSRDLNEMMPSHPAADRMLAPRGKLSQPAPESGEVMLDSTEAGPAVPPLSPTERMVSKQLGAVADKGKTLTHQTPSGWLNRQLANRVAPFLGVSAPKLGQKMINLLDNSAARMSVGAVEGAAGMLANKKMKELIEAVSSSDNPELEHYLAQEMSPEYKAVAMEAASEIEKEAGSK